MWPTHKIKNETQLKKQLHVYLVIWPEIIKWHIDHLRHAGMQLNVEDRRAARGLLQIVPHQILISKIASFF